MPQAQKGEKQIVVTAFLISDSSPRKILLHHHKKFNVWMPPGGHQEPFENTYEALIREVKEETGIDITPHIDEPKHIENGVIAFRTPDFIYEEYITVIKDQENHYHQDHIYFIEVPYQDIRHNHDESHDINWFAQDEVHRLDLITNVRKLIEEAFTRYN